jgi:hypothetical protein
VSGIESAPLSLSLSLSPRLFICRICLQVDSKLKLSVESEDYTPYFMQVVKYLMPDLLRGLGLGGDIKFTTEVSATREPIPDKYASP